nr:hypothetical protein [Tanacetum cinerariifolium]
HQNEVNEIRAERIARAANPLTLVDQQQPVNHPHNHPTHNTQNSSTRSQQAATRNKGKAIVNSPLPIYDQEPSMVAENDEMSKDKEIDKLMALISLSFKKIYKPTNNNHRTSSNTSRANQDNSPRINRGDGYDNQRLGNVVGARETVEDTLDAADSGPIFDFELVQMVSNDDHYNVFAIESDHPEQSKSVHDTYPIEQDDHKVIIDSLDMSYDREQIEQNDDLANERELLASLIEKLKCEIDDSKNHNKFLETSNKVLVEKQKGLGHGYVTTFIIQKARHMLGSEYGEQDRKAVVLYDKSKEKVVSSNSEESEADDFSELKKITALLAKAFNRRKYYSKPTNNNLRTSPTSESTNKKQEFVKTDNKKVGKKDDEKKRDMSRVKCYNYKKEGHFAKDCKKVKVKDYEY